MASRFLRLHVKTLVDPPIAIDTMMSAMRQVYSVADIDVSLVSTEALSLPALCDLDVGDCDGPVTPAQQALFSNRGNALATDVVAYVVRTLIPPSEGCAAHPPDRPGLVLAPETPWGLAHEVGHVLGLRHVDNDDYLMTGNGTVNITNPPPRLSPEEIATMQQSPLVTQLSAHLTTLSNMLRSHSTYDEKLAGLPQGGHEALAAIAGSDDPALASRAVYLASLTKTATAVESVRKGLLHPHPHVRVSAAAALKNLAPRDRARLAVLLRDERDAGVRRTLKHVGGVTLPRSRRQTAKKKST